MVCWENLLVCWDHLLVMLGVLFDVLGAEALAGELLVCWDCRAPSGKIACGHKVGFVQLIVRLERPSLRGGNHGSPVATFGPQRPTDATPPRRVAGARINPVIAREKAAPGCFDLPFTSLPPGFHGASVTPWRSERQMASTVSDWHLHPYTRA